MERTAQPVEGQFHGQETAADHPSPLSTDRIRTDASCLSRLVVQRLRLTIRPER